MLSGIPAAFPLLERVIPSTRRVSPGCVSRIMGTSFLHTWHLQPNPGRVNGSLPRLYVISPGKPGQASARAGLELVPWVEALVEAGPVIFQLREPQLTDPELTQLAQTLLPILEARGSSLVLNAGKGAGIRVARRLKLPLHLDAEWPVAGLRRELPGLFLGASVHSLSAARQAHDAGAEMLLMGPILGVPAGSSATPLGLDALTRMATETGLPIFALGGILPERCADVIRAGACGVAVRGALFEPPPGAEGISPALLSARAGTYLESLRAGE